MKKIIILILVFSLISVLLVSCSHKEFSQLSDNDQKEYIWANTQTIVQKQLKSPDSAKFPLKDEAVITNLGDNNYEVQSYVDAQNSFGAIIRTNFDVKLQIDNNYDSTYDWYNFKCLDCQIGN